MRGGPEIPGTGIKFAVSQQLGRARGNHRHGGKTKRGAENVQTIPIAITAISQAELLAKGAQEFEDYARSVPSLSFVDAGPAFKTYVIRGINATGTGVATVGQYVDDVLITGDLRQPDLRLYDIQRIEVLRGPQGTLYGSGSLSGTIRTITNPPDPTGYHADVIANVSMLIPIMAAAITAGQSPSTRRSAIAPLFRVTRV